MGDYQKFKDSQGESSNAHKIPPERLIDMQTSELGLTTAEVERRLARDGPNSLPEKKVNPVLNFLKYYWGPMPVMIWAAMLIELIRLDFLDLVVLCVLQFLNGIIGWYEERNAGNAIEALKQKLAPKAVVRRDGEWQVVEAKSLVVGDRIKIKLGDIVPADAVLGPGFCEVDQSALTGESLAVMKYEGDEVYQGAVCKRGDLEAIVSGTGRHTFFGKTSTLVSSVNQRGNFQKILFKVAMFLLCISTLLVVIILVVVSSKGNDFLETLSICVVLLVASIPIAMQVVCATTMAVGAHALAKRQAIVSRLNSIEELAGMQVLCSDKTGTLTKNELTVQIPRLIGDTQVTDIFLAAALAAKRDGGNQDAIDKCITDMAVNTQMLAFDEYEEEDFIPFDPKIKRTEATIRHKPSGDVFKVTKGAPQVVLALCASPSIELEVSNIVEELAQGGYRTLGVARTDSTTGTWNLLGLIPLYDPPRNDTAETIQKAKVMGVSVKMITGDQIAIAKETARLLKLGDKIYNSDVFSESGNQSQQKMMEEVLMEADGFAEVFPEHKFAIVEMMQERGMRTGMTGDGVNDAPALKKADVGIAVAGATDAARAAADIVLTAPGLSVIIEAIYRSRKIFQRMKNYVIYRIACTFQLLVFFFVTMVGINPNSYLCTHHSSCANIPNTFSLPVIALVLITILNDGTIISIAYDRVTVSKQPEKWNLTVVFVMAVLLGLIAFFSSLIILLLSLNNMDALHPNAFFQSFNLGTFSYPELLTIIWLKVAIQDFLTVFSARTHYFFFTRFPGKLLLLAFTAATTISTILAVYWFLNFSGATGEGDVPEMQGIEWKVAGFVWLYDLVWFGVQDVCKVGVYKAFECYFSLTQPDKPLYTGEFLTDSFLIFSTGYDHPKSIVTRRSLEAVKPTENTRKSTGSSGSRASKEEKCEDERRIHEQELARSS